MVGNDVLFCIQQQDKRGIVYIEMSVDPVVTEGFHALIQSV